MLEAGAETESKDDLGRTPLLFAVYLHKPGSVKTLLRYGALAITQGSLEQTGFFQLDRLNDQLFSCTWCRYRALGMAQDSGNV